MKRNAAHNPNKAKLSNPKFDYCVLEVNDEFMLIILIPENLTSTAVIRWKRREEAALCQPEKMTEVLRGLLWVDVGAVWVWVWLVVGAPPPSGFLFRQPLHSSAQRPLCDSRLALPLRFPRDFLCISIPLPRIPFLPGPFHRLQRLRRLLNLQPLLPHLPRRRFQVPDSPFQVFGDAVALEPPFPDSFRRLLWAASCFHLPKPCIFPLREIFHLSDGGTIALDWLRNSDVLGDAFSTNNAIDTTPIVLVIPGLTSDSKSPTLTLMYPEVDRAFMVVITEGEASIGLSQFLVMRYNYIKHLAFNTAKNGWNAVVSNHRGLGGVSVTSDCFYNAGWTEDLRSVVNNLHHEYPKAPLFLVGTSIGANVLVKYLGEDGDKTPAAGAVAVCSPWDLLLGDRFIGRRLLQKFYDKALTIGLQGYAQLHQPHFLRLANWEGIKKVGCTQCTRLPLYAGFGRGECRLALPPFMERLLPSLEPETYRSWAKALAIAPSATSSRSIRDFDQHATCIVGNFETVDTFYRRCTSATYVGNVAVPLLCISALDDPVCTREAIPWDECWANKNIVLATTKHGGHLAFFEGLTASGIWWVRAVDEYLKILHSSQYMHVQKMVSSCPQLSLDFSIDHQGPYVNVAEDGMVAAVGNEQAMDNKIGDVLKPQKIHYRATNEMVSGEQDEEMIQAELHLFAEIPQSSEQVTSMQDAKPLDVTTSVRRCLDRHSRQSKWSLWLLVYVCIATSWPLVGSALKIVLQKKLRNLFRK
ncbi:hypothetical protein DVH24_037592 [Malus domestica]|uniref:Serine aminopeptidase S33 domain-containing protein n=1 Tax=Malus domestica TaxID=3750 RepID=A0A498J097_MALDO|nr:hypothetical protein DVH24_037592 [Malus domestica]